VVASAGFGSRGDHVSKTLEVTSKSSTLFVLSSLKLFLNNFRQKQQTEFNEWILLFLSSSAHRNKQREGQTDKSKLHLQTTAHKFRRYDDKKTEVKNT